MQSPNDQPDSGIDTRTTARDTTGESAAPVVATVDMGAETFLYERGNDEAWLAATDDVWAEVRE